VVAPLPNPESRAGTPKLPAPEARPFTAGKNTSDWKTVRIVPDAATRVNGDCTSRSRRPCAAVFLRSHRAGGYGASRRCGLQSR
jgi:hypothetical protein